MRRTNSLIANPANCIKNSLAIMSESYGSVVTLKLSTVELSFVTNWKISLTFFSEENQLQVQRHTQHVPHRILRSGKLSHQYPKTKYVCYDFQRSINILRCYLIDRECRWKKTMQLLIISWFANNSIFTPLSLKQRESNSSRLNFRAPLNSKDEMHTRTYIESIKDFVEKIFKRIYVPVEMSMNLSSCMKSEGCTIARFFNDNSSVGHLVAFIR